MSKWISSFFDQRTGFRFIFILSIISLLAYSNSFQNEFMFDDHIILFGEKGVANKSVSGLFLDYQGNFYRPVGHIFLKVCHTLFGEQVVLYHFANFLLFLLICWLFFTIAMRLFQNRTVAFLASLLYAVHPINGMLVNYVTASVISTFIIMLQLSFLCFLKFLDARKSAYYYLSLFFFVGGLFSHEMSLIFPLYLLALLFSFKKPISIYKLCIPFLFISGAYFSLRMYLFSLAEHLKGTADIWPYSGIYLASLSDLLLWYFSKLLWPQDILFLWTGFLFDEVLLIKIIRLLAFVCVVGYGIFVFSKHKEKSFALWLFVIGLIPLACSAFAYFPFSEPIIEPHWFYFSSYGFFLLAAHLLFGLKKRINAKAWLVICVALIVVNILLLRQNNSFWKNEKTYAEHWLKLNPRNLTPYYALGKMALQENDPQKAIDFFTNGLEAVSYNNEYVSSDLGYAYFLMGDRERAEEYYQLALDFDDQYSKTYFYQGLLYLSQQEYTMAETAFLMAVNIYPQEKLYDQYLTRARQGQGVN